jgi:hypothetical protein
MLKFQMADWWYWWAEIWKQYQQDVHSKNIIKNTLTRHWFSAPIYYSCRLTEPISITGYFITTSLVSRLPLYHESSWFTTPSMVDVTFENLLSQRCWDRMWRTCIGYKSFEKNRAIFCSLNLTNLSLHMFNSASIWNREFVRNECVSVFICRDQLNSIYNENKFSVQSTNQHLRGADISMILQCTCSARSNW